MLRLSRTLLAACAAVSLSISMMAAVAAVCPDGTMATASPNAAHDCETPAPAAPATDDHDPCRMLTPCVSIVLVRAQVMLAENAQPQDQLPSARTAAPPTTIARAPAPPPPRA